VNLQEISDRLEIQDAVHRLVRGFDRRDWPTVEHLLADTVVTDYTAMLGGEPQTRTAAEQTRYYQEQLDPMDATMHAATTFLVDLDGDSATASVNILTWLRRDAALDGAMWSNGAAGEIELTRTGGRWRIAAIIVRPVWAEGNRGVLAPTG
jgi:hypothetical protein